MKSKLKNFSLLTISTLIMAVGIYFFKFANNFTFGGITGIAVLVAKFLPISASDFSFVVNILLLIIFKFHYVSINSRPKTNRLFTPQNLSILSTSSKYIISFSLFIICFNNTSYFSHFLLLSIPCVFYTITGRQKSLYFYHIKFFISLTLPIMNPINQICNPNIQIHI